MFAAEQSTVIAGLPQDDEETEYMTVESLGNGLIEAHDLSEDDVADADDGAAEDTDAAPMRIVRQRDDSEAGRTQRALEHAEARTAAKAASARQKALYGNEGQYNPNAARAAKKRARREAKAVAEADADDSASDFDWDN